MPSSNSSNSAFRILAVITTLAWGVANRVLADTPSSKPAQSQSAGAATNSEDALLGVSPSIRDLGYGVSASDFSVGISANPGALTIGTGTGELEDRLMKLLKIDDDYGFRFGGIYLGDYNHIISGGAQPGASGWNSLLILGGTLQTDKLSHGIWQGGEFGIEFLRYDGQNVNNQAGSLQGFNSLPVAAPYDRSELFQLWYRQSFFDNKLSIRIGKIHVTKYFDNVLRTVPMDDPSAFIGANSGLLYTPVFINAPTFAEAGYYNSACGVSIALHPVKWWYFSYGFYDGNQARGIQTGLLGPEFNGYYFHVWETGFAWSLGRNKLPGTFGTGLWDQTGTFYGPTPNIVNNGFQGWYAYASQRLWYMHPGRDASGILALAQYAGNDASTQLSNQFMQAAVTGFGLIPGRPKDSLGAGMAWAWLNPNYFERRSELMFQAYYQAHVGSGFYFVPAITYIPTPGDSVAYQTAWAMTLRVMMLF